MSQENVEIVRQGFEAFERGELDVMLDLFTDDVITYRVDPTERDTTARPDSSTRPPTGRRISASGRCFPRSSPIWVSGSWFGSSR